ncbi:Protein artichoke [Gryllus bimaculatus]|nr:Protein artichoke [Gryllus bimaculatus]
MKVCVGNVGAMVPRPSTPLVGLALVLLVVPLAQAGAKKCGGPCRCLELPPEDPDEGFGVLVNCSGVPADAGGAVPVPSDASLAGGVRGAAFARLSFAGCGAERLLHLEAPAGVPLRALDLSRNALAALLDRVLDGVAGDLRALRLDRNALRELNGDALRPLRALRLLDVADNQLRDLDLAALPPGLLRLRAADNRIAELRALPLNSPPLGLQVSRCRSTARRSNCRCFFTPVLAELDLSGNALTRWSARAGGAGQLTSLRLAGTRWRSGTLDGGRPAALAAPGRVRGGLRALSCSSTAPLVQLLAATTRCLRDRSRAPWRRCRRLQCITFGQRQLCSFPGTDYNGDTLVGS